nr:MAG TPA: hypothetical protein [Bacteriophage sp.]
MKSNTCNPVISIASPSLNKYKNGKPTVASSGKTNSHASCPS